MLKYFLPLFILLLFSCKEEKLKRQEVKVEGLAQGTSYHVTYITDTGVNYQRAIDSLLIEIDNSLSTYQPRSVISRFNQADSIQEIDPLFKDVFMMAKEVYQLTNGAFDPTIAPVVNAWGFGFKNSNQTDSLTIDSLMQFVNFNSVSIADNIAVKRNSGVMLDFNAIAQGYSVDVLANFLKNNGIRDFLVEVGGEVVASGKNINDTLWRVGIDRPIENLKERELEAIIHLKNIALATSGNYRKFYEKDGMKYAHTINPKTGYPVQHSLLSVTVLAEHCAMADAYATAFMVMGLDKTKEFLLVNEKIHALLIYEDENKKIKTYTTPYINDIIELNQQ
ncbi:MAG: FAD:protein FMN transferase [Vicingus serpentipes]|nr:FAD:protein FMN transferase [Vicingus serpentipes]